MRERKRKRERERKREKGRKRELIDRQRVRDWSLDMTGSVYMGNRDK